MTTSLLEHAEYAPLFHSCEVIQGRDNALMQQVFELRFQIYCLERGFLSAADYPDGCEIDEYDASSAHFCAFSLQEVEAQVGARDPGLFACLQKVERRIVKPALVN